MHASIIHPFNRFSFDRMVQQIFYNWKLYLAWELTSQLSCHFHQANEGRREKECTRICGSIQLTHISIERNESDSFTLVFQNKSRNERAWYWFIIKFDAVMWLNFEHLNRKRAFKGCCILLRLYGGCCCFLRKNQQAPHFQWCGWQFGCVCVCEYCETGYRDMISS